MDHSQEIKTFATSLGFDLVKITRADTLVDAGAYYEEWLNKGYGADMEYLKKDSSKRYTPEKILPGAKSMIMLGLNYCKKERQFRDGFRVAKYAQGRDYHKVISAKLKKLGKFLENISATQKSYVDFGPVMERAYAQHASLGFVGKNACIITREYGSYVFLSEVFTTLELTPDKPTAWKGSCGTCTRCINICPTRAIKPDKTIDSNLCISYLTIENRGDIPLALRPKIGNWLFGCDLCQDICPHNVRAQPTRVKDFQNIPVGEENITLSQILSIETDDEFTQIFAGTPIMRAKRRGLIRNACVVAGNLRLKELIPQLQKLSHSDDTMIAEHARWSLETITTPTSSPRPPSQHSHTSP